MNFDCTDFLLINSYNNSHQEFRGLIKKAISLQAYHPLIRQWMMGVIDDLMEDPIDTDVVLQNMQYQDEGNNSERPEAKYKAV